MRHLSEADPAVAQLINREETRIENTLDNAVLLAEQLAARGFRIVTGGTQNHRVLVDMASKGIRGSDAENILEAVGIITNRNVIARDAETPGAVSGLRLGTAAISSRGMGTAEVKQIAALIDTALVNCKKKEVLDQVAGNVSALCRAFPVYGSGEKIA